MVYARILLHKVICSFDVAFETIMMEWVKKPPDEAFDRLFESSFLLRLIRFGQRLRARAEVRKSKKLKIDMIVVGENLG